MTFASQESNSQLTALRTYGWAAPPDGNTLFGTLEIASYLGLPYQTVGRLMRDRVLPVGRVDRAYTSTRSSLAAFIIDAERKNCMGTMVADPPNDIRPNGCLGLLKGQKAFGSYLGLKAGRICNSGVIRHLPHFKLGRLVFARQASLDAFAQAAGIVSDPTETDPDILVGIKEIAEWLNIHPRTVAQWHIRRLLPTLSLRQHVLARKSTLREYVVELEARSVSSTGFDHSLNDIGSGDPLCLIQGYDAIGHILGLSAPQVAYYIKHRRLPSFRIGGMRLARRSSLAIFDKRS